MSVLIRNATIVTMNDAWDVVAGDVHVENGRILAVGSVGEVRVDRVIDAGGGYLLPGFIQTHVHLCQTLFRGYADDLPLLDWLRQRIWPMEAAHTPRSLAVSARLAAAELLRGGTTSVLTMETVHDTDAVFEALAPTGLRAVIGKCMMDANAEVPVRLMESTRASLDESVALAKRWPRGGEGRLSAAFAPRFALSCSRELLEAVSALSRVHGVLVHSHAAENREEVASVRAETGVDNITYFDRVGLASPRLCLAHCVWVDEAEQNLLADREVKVLHCPGSNLKLASGIAPVAAMRRRGISVSLGADGGACNNSLDMFSEMRLAATLQGMTCGSGALTARDALWMATREGARAIGRADDLGAVVVGRRADLMIIDRGRAHLATAPDPYSAIVFSARPSDVRTVIVEGDVLVDRFQLTRVDEREIVAEARIESRALAARL